MNCNHKSRAEATACPFFRAHKSERIPPLHGPNAFTWQLTLTQDAILGGICPFDPAAVHVEHVFAPIRFVFDNSPEQFADDLFQLRAMGLVWIDCESGLTGYTVEGREHVEAELAKHGKSIATMRLGSQAEAPSTFTYGPRTLIDRVTAVTDARLPKKELVQ